MKLWQIIMIVISIAIVIYIWHPRWFGKKGQTVEHAMETKAFKMVPESEMKELEIQEEPPQTVPLKAKRDFKVTITWIIATLNGLVILATQIKNILK